MKNKNISYADIWKAIGIVAILFILLFIAYDFAWGAVYNYRLSSDSSSRWDSCYVIMQQNGVDTDSFYVASQDTTIAIQDTSNWLFVIYDLYDGSSDKWWRVNDWLWFDLNVSATATVDYDSIASIVSNAVSPGGSGSENIGLLAYDTANSLAIQSVRHLVYNTATGVLQGTPQYTNANGYTLWKLDVGSYEVISFLGGYQIDIDTITVTADDSLQISGYPIDIPNATASHVCAVTIKVVDNEGNNLSGIRVVARLVRSNLVDSSGLAIYNATQSDTTASTGLVTFQCLSSYYTVPNTKWEFIIPTIGNLRFQMNVPDQASYMVDINDFR